jgi:hypothetical protein
MPRGKPPPLPLHAATPEWLKGQHRHRPALRTAAKVMSIPWSCGGQGTRHARCRPALFVAGTHATTAAATVKGKQQLPPYAYNYKC